MSIYAYVCSSCDHLVTRHLMTPLAPSVEGPYRCKDCGCEISQSSRVYGLTKREYEAAFTPTGRRRA